LDARHLFLSRQHFPHARRRLSNFSEIRPILDRYGYHVFTPDNCSLAQQVQTFAAAKTVVGTHGAGLASIVFMDRGADVVLLDSARNIQPGHTAMFTVLAEMMGHRSFLLECAEQTTNGSPSADIPHLRDLSVDSVAFSSVLDRIHYSRIYG
jgi:capsular polysaccharide biosynthesis protein